MGRAPLGRPRVSTPLLISWAHGGHRATLGSVLGPGQAGRYSPRGAPRGWIPGAGWLGRLWQKQRPWGPQTLAGLGCLCCSPQRPGQGWPCPQVGNSCSDLRWWTGHCWQGDRGSLRLQVKGLARTLPVLWPFSLPHPPQDACAAPLSIRVAVEEGNGKQLKQLLAVGRDPKLYVVGWEGMLLVVRYAEG